MGGEVAEHAVASIRSGEGLKRRGKFVSRAWNRYAVAVWTEEQGDRAEATEGACEMRHLKGSCEWKTAGS
jgi:hypothetical protein